VPQDASACWHDRWHVPGVADALALARLARSKGRSARSTGRSLARDPEPSLPASGSLVPSEGRLRWRPVPNEAGSPRDGDEKRRVTPAPLNVGARVTGRRPARATDQKRPDPTSQQVEGPAGRSGPGRKGRTRHGPGSRARAAPTGFYGRGPLV
jgi:hypothetical protein